MVQTYLQNQDLKKLRLFIKLNGFLILMGVLLIVVLLGALKPSYRDRLKEYFMSDKKVVLSTVSGRVSVDGPSFIITKVRYKSKLWVEVYKLDAKSGATQFWQTLSLDSHQDAYLGLNIKSANLALLDLDHDNTLEIVAPTFDEKMNSKLNIFKYNASSGFFVPE